MRLILGLGALIAFVLSCGAVLAAPVISSVSGNYAEGGTITIQGAAFGSGPNLVLFDNFEGGATGAPIRTGAGSATVGAWSFKTGTVYYTDTHSVSGAQAFQADHAIPGNHYSAVNFTPDTQAFLSWWFYLPAGDKWPGENHQDGINWKIVWIMGACNYIEDRVLPVVLGSGATLTGNGLACDWCPDWPPQDYSNPIDDSWTDLDVQKGRWMRVWTWLKGGYQNDGAIQYWELTSSGVGLRVDRSNFNTLYPPGTMRPSGICGANSPATALYQTVYMNAYGRSTPPSHPTFDDFYLATGPNARARVEIGNQPTYNASTKLAILTASSWSSTSITAVMRQGIFRPGDTAYLFVFDAAGNVSAASQAITIGGTGSGDSLPPDAPENLRVS